MKNLGLTTCALLISMLAIPWAGAEGNKVQKPNEKTYDETYVTGEHQIHLVELFSSEGCSSCPPAESWVASLKGHPALWQKFVPIEFHVDYWNQLGWVDPFSNGLFTKRQREYASEWGTYRIYTPGFAFNGAEWRGLQTFNVKVTQKSPDGKPGRLKVIRKKELEFEVRFAAHGDKKEDYILHGVVLGNGLETKVPAGENEGRTLKHEFVVLTMEKVVLKRKGQEWVGNLTLPSPENSRARSYSVAFWARKPDSMKPIQAVGGPIAYRPTP
ncbi:MAG: DUF1223 domain-containing protein [Bdellovibrionaceae bacterium]|nr:DUF1223 domain-containing protein [Bdellovibrionales bacterium]MCB9085969.1 DUF1223 domain-containing protein [Pseudobdellovibrionaceae bacterium]